MVVRPMSDVVGSGSPSESKQHNLGAFLSGYTRRNGGEARRGMVVGTPVRLLGLIGVRG